MEITILYIACTLAEFQNQFIRIFFKTLRIIYQLSKKKKRMAMDQGVYVSSSNNVPLAIRIT